MERKTLLKFTYMLPQTIEQIWMNLDFSHLSVSSKSKALLWAHN